MKNFKEVLIEIFSPEKKVFNKEKALDSLYDTIKTVDDKIEVEQNNCHKIKLDIIKNKSDKTYCINKMKLYLKTKDDIQKLEASKDNLLSMVKTVENYEINQKIINCKNNYMNKIDTNDNKIDKLQDKNDKVDENVKTIDDFNNHIKITADLANQTYDEGELESNLDQLIKEYDNDMNLKKINSVEIPRGKLGNDKHKKKKNKEKEELREAELIKL